MQFVFYSNLNLRILQIPQEHSFLPQHVVNLIKTKKIDIAMNPISSRVEHRAEVLIPVRIGKACIAVPVGKEIPTYMYLIRPFQNSLWITIFISIFLLSVILHYSRILCSQNSEISDAVCQVIKGILCQSFPRDFNKRKLRMRLICLGIFILGFVLTNIYLPFAMSFFAKTDYKLDVNTFEDMIRENIKLNLSKDDILNRFKSLNIPPEYAEKLAVNATDDKTGKREDEYTAYAYILAPDQWEFTKVTQFRFNSKLQFRLLDICANNIYITYAIQENSYLVFPFQIFVMRVHEAGLYKLWELQTFRIYTNAKKMNKNVAEKTSFKTLKLSYLKIIRYVWIIGMLAGIFTFIYECRCKIKENILNKLNF